MEIGTMILKILTISYVWSSKDDEELESAMVLVFFMTLCGLELAFISKSSMTAFLFSLSMIGGLCVLILFIIKLTTPSRELKSNKLGSKLFVLITPLSSGVVLLFQTELMKLGENFKYKDMVTASTWSSESPLLMEGGVASLLFVVSLLMMMLFIIEYSTSHKMPIQL